MRAVARVVLDTNVLLASIPYKSRYRIIIDRLEQLAYTLVVTTDILLEYEEKMEDFYGKETASNFIDALILLPNVMRKEPLFSSALINDADDNKFLDAYYTGKANLLVTNDTDFKVLKKIEYPAHHIMNIDEFVAFLKKNPPPGAGDYQYAMAA